MSSSNCCCRQSCCCKQTCCGPIGGNYYSRGCCTFPSLIILILVLLFFGREFGGCGHHGGCRAGVDPCGCEKRPVKDDKCFAGIIFIITLYFLSCGCGGFGRGIGPYGGFGGYGGYRRF
ncbi:hypothetical protein [Oceanirhabdus sp. W0125-5]|uniref:hypothetical protein n=1 Tax=Oceanirhabdus sp. W0125-5 TaxID=2999116 RepID=UPI0022F330CA|nr:hypothetical protein [Oceanirhabdus sp. W0125-5]WBW98922.1 hypothetical protein OW730_09310 [Oceanirhabdus sp. W0125-5]